jgi:hypothetical protein
MTQPRPVVRSAQGKPTGDSGKQLARNAAAGAGVAHAETDGSSRIIWRHSQPE